MEPLDPRRTALLVIDMQNGFCHEDGSLARSGLDHRAGAAVIPAVDRLVGAARSAGATVGFTRYSLKPDYSDAGRLFDVSPDLRVSSALVAGSWDAALIDELTPLADELIVDKTRYSAFWDTGLRETLNGLGVATVVLCGVTTNVCVEGTARDAFAADFEVIVCRDATAAVSQELHEASLRSMAYGLGTVVDAGDLASAFNHKDR
jgi:ureidoacrylate peracid hydrolase